MNEGIMGNTVILTKNHPSELDTIERAEAVQISLLGGTTGDQIVQEQHGWWNEREQKAEFLATTLRPETPLPFEEARRVYTEQISVRVLEGYVHSRSYSFTENRFVYRDLREVAGYKTAGGSR
ncbi:MAG: hypothetical protein WA853_17840 [Candidatus Acidiferrum sp.]